MVMGLLRRRCEGARPEIRHVQQAGGGWRWGWGHISNGWRHKEQRDNQKTGRNKFRNCTGEGRASVQRVGAVAPTGIPKALNATRSTGAIRHPARREPFTYFTTFRDDEFFPWTSPHAKFALRPLLLTRDLSQMDLGGGATDTDWDNDQVLDWASGCSQSTAEVEAVDHGADRQWEEGGAGGGGGGAVVKAGQTCPHLNCCTSTSKAAVMVRAGFRQDTGKGPF